MITLEEAKDAYRYMEQITVNFEEANSIDNVERMRNDLKLFLWKLYGYSNIELCISKYFAIGNDFDGLSDRKYAINILYPGNDACIKDAIIAFCYIRKNPETWQNLLNIFDKSN